MLITNVKEEHSFLKVTLFITNLFVIDAFFGIFRFLTALRKKHQVIILNTKQIFTIYGKFTAYGEANFKTVCFVLLTY